MPSDTCARQAPDDVGQTRLAAGVELRSLPLSNVLTKAATRDLQRLTRRADDIEARIDALDAERRKLRDALLETHQRMDVLRQVALGADLGEAAATILSGARLRQEAARIMAERVGIRTPIHYREWYQLVLAEGYIVVGKRPLSTFLTGAARASVIQKGNDPGTYLLEPQLVDRLRAQLLELQGELADVQQMRASDPRLGSKLRQHAVNLKASIRKLERKLHEGELVTEHARRAAGQVHAA